MHPQEVGDEGDNRVNGGDTVTPLIDSGSHRNQRKRGLDRAAGPAAGLPHGRVREAVQRSGAVADQGVQVIWRRVTLVLSQAVLRVQLVELFHAAVPINFGQNRCRGNGNRAGIAVNQSFLFDGQIKFESVEQKIIWEGT